MKNKLTLALATLALAATLWGCQEAETPVQEVEAMGINANANPAFTIVKGTVAHPQNSAIMGPIIINQGGRPIDTVELDGNNRFAVKIYLTQPDFFQFNFYNTTYIDLVLYPEKQETISLEIEGKLSISPYVVSGSEENEYLHDVKRSFKQRTDSLRYLQGQVQKLVGEGKEQEAVALNQQGQAYFTSSLEEVMGKIEAHERCLADLSVLAELDYNSERGFALYDNAATALGQKYGGMVQVQNLMQFVMPLRNIQLGSKAPNLNLPTPEGDSLALSDLQGQYVLIDFWAQWCKPCRAENPNIVAAYNQYKDKGFTVLGVSLDRYKESWVKAINEDQLTWHHISDLGYWQSSAAQEYSVRSIPASWLVDPNGVIIARNLRGPALHSKLAEVLGGS